MDALVLLARNGLAHGDLSPYNLLVHRDRLVMIDLPQVIDVVTNPHGPSFLQRDALNVSKWFAGRGLPYQSPGPNDLADYLLKEARVG